MSKGRKVHCFYAVLWIIPFLLTAFSGSGWSQDRGEELQPGEEQAENGTWKTPDPLSSLDIRSCSLVTSSHNFMEGKLSDNWAFELTGADLLKAELTRLPPIRQKNFVVVFDDSYGEHDIKVKNIISDEGTHAVLPELEEESVPIFRVRGSPVENYTYTARKLQRAIPSFINNSQGWNTTPRAVYNAFKNLSPPAVVVTSAGNRFPAGTDRAKARASKMFDVIIVGSFSPSGFVSAFSQSGEEVHILAPSDNYLNSANGEGEYRQFGKTSGAAPIVTASLAGFEWLSGYHPSPEEAKILLKRTAIPTIHIHENPRENGIGLVNTYKLGRVGGYLREICAGQRPSSSCFKREIRKRENYTFLQTYSNIQDDLIKFFPRCSIKHTGENIPEATCEEKGIFFNHLRRSVLLQPYRRDLWEILSCIYKDGGFDKNGEVLDRIALSLRSTKEVLHKLKVLMTEEESVFGMGALRVLMALEEVEEGNRILERLAHSNNQDSKINAVYLAGNRKNSLGDGILQKLVRVQTPDVRYNVAKVLGFTGGERQTRIKILHELTEDSDPNVQKVADMMLRKLSLKETRTLK